MKTRLIPVLLVLFAAVCTAPAHATLPGAEWNIDTSLNAASFFGGEGVTLLRAQSFEAVQGGRVESVRLRIGRASDHEMDLRVMLFALGTDGFPTGDALLSGDFPPASIPVMSIAVTAFDFPANQTVELAAGRRYALVTTAAEPGTESLFYLNGGFGEEATYEAGQALRSSDGAAWFAGDLDFAFQVLVDDSVPVRSVSWGRVKTLY